MFTFSFFRQQCTAYRSFDVHIHIEKIYNYFFILTENKNIILEMLKYQKMLRKVAIEFP